MNTRNIGNEAKINPKTGRIDQACERYGVGRSTMRRIAEESGAVVRVDYYGKRYISRGTRGHLGAGVFNMPEYK